MSKTLDKIDNFERIELKKLYEQCTKKQQEFFNRMYVSVDEIPKEKISWAIRQCERTIIKNMEKENE